MINYISIINSAKEIWDAGISLPGTEKHLFMISLLETRQHLEPK